MLRAGRTQKLTVSRVSEYGLYLTDEEQNEVLLPNRYISLADKPGDEKEVFVYHDSEDRLVATTETPLLRAGEATAWQRPLPAQPQPAGRHPRGTELHRIPL